MFKKTLPTQTPQWIYTDENGNSLYGMTERSMKNGAAMKLPAVYTENGWEHIQDKNSDLLKFQNRFSKIRKVLYNLPYVLECENVFITADERTADELNTLMSQSGWTAATAGSFGNWNDSFSRCLAGKNIVILIENLQDRNAVEMIRSELDKTALVSVVPLAWLNNSMSPIDWMSGSIHFSVPPYTVNGINYPQAEYQLNNRGLGTESELKAILLSEKSVMDHFLDAFGKWIRCGKNSRFEIIENGLWKIASVEDLRRLFDIWADILQRKFSVVFDPDLRNKFLGLKSNFDNVLNYMRTDKRLYKKRRPGAKK